MSCRRARADAGTAEEDGAGGAVIGAEPAVLGHATAELTEGHQQNAVGQAGGSEVCSKRKQGGREVSQQVIMGVELITVCVVAGLAGVIDAGAQACADQPGDDSKASGQSCIGI